jgi:hypothetical protein
MKKQEKEQRFKLSGEQIEIEIGCRMLWGMHVGYRKQGWTEKLNYNTVTKNLIQPSSELWSWDGLPCWDGARWLCLCTPEYTFSCHLPSERNSANNKCWRGTLLRAVLCQYFQQFGEWLSPSQHGIWQHSKPLPTFMLFRSVASYNTFWVRVLVFIFSGNSWKKKVRGMNHYLSTFLGIAHLLPLPPILQ